MSDIPVGSPPAPPGRHAAPSGWYPDPVDLRQERYWDGWQWSRNTRAAEGPVPAHPYQQAVVAPAQPYHPPTQQYYATPQPPVAGGTAVLTADGVPVSGWWWRVLSAVVDWFIVSIIAVLPGVPIYREMLSFLGDYFSRSLEAAEAGQPPPPTPGVAELISTSDQLLLALISVSVTFVYVTLFWRFKGATPGKMLCGLRVVPVDQGQFRGRLPWGATLVRALLWALPGSYALLQLFQLVDVLFPLGHPKRQALHDLAAKTQVVKIR